MLILGITFNRILGLDRMAAQAARCACPGALGIWDAPMHEWYMCMDGTRRHVRPCMKGAWMVHVDHVSHARRTWKEEREDKSRKEVMDKRLVGEIGIRWRINTDA